MTLLLRICSQQSVPDNKYLTTCAHMDMCVAVKRIMQEARELIKEPSTDFAANPLEVMKTTILSSFESRTRMTAMMCLFALVVGDMTDVVDDHYFTHWVIFGLHPRDMLRPQV
jgi:phosphatidylethanolamine-binding protein (PEBP) family uncharacterized protein